MGMPEQSQFSQGGMKINVTPHSPVQPASATARQKQGPRRQINVRALAVVAAIIVIVVAGVLVVPHLLAKPPTTVTTTTIPVSNVSALSSCQNIDQPGSYYLSGSIQAPKVSGSCITINANNVALICNQDSITGHGPFSNTTPYSYGIYVNGTSHDTISSCVVNSFSYGVYARNAPSLTIVQSNVSQNAMSDIFLESSPNATIGSDYLSKASSSEGALHLAGGSSGANVYNNTIVQNVFAGIYLNSTRNDFTKNYINSTPASFQCLGSAGFLNSSHAVLNTCDNNFGCDFLKCRIENVPLNFSQIKLTSQIRTCGAIDEPGIYSIKNALSLNEYTPGLVQNYTVPCITISASDVMLNCNGYPISGAQIGISATSQSNLTLNDCRVRASAVGMAFSNVKTSNVTNSIFINGTLGLSLLNSSSNAFTGLLASGLGTGIYVRNSTLNTFDSFNASDNAYGIYVNDSLGNVFNKGVAQNNSRMDVYATNDSVNASYNVMQETSCGLTDAAWAPCTQHVSPTLKYYPIDSCMVIHRSGNYTLTSSIVTGTTTCFDIRVSDVRLSCAGFSLTQLSHSSNSTAVLARNVSDVTVARCGMYYFRNGVLAINSTAVSVLNSTIQYGSTGVAFDQVLNATVAYDQVAFSSASGISMRNTYFSHVRGNNVSSGRPTGVGILLNGSMYNTVAGNLASSDYMGLYLINSTNNTVLNNTVQLSGSYDYYCDAPSSGLAADNGGINYGVAKHGCLWLAAIEPPSLNSCTAFLTPTTYDLSTDMVYPSANLCYGVYANSTTINCMGHTVLATNGGTFALFKNTRSGTIENCNLKGFTTPIEVVNSTVKIINNTIYSNTPGRASQAAISVDGSTDIYIASNNVTSQSSGISLRNVSGGQLLGNSAASVYAAYSLYNSSALTASSNRGESSSSYGLQLSGSPADTFTNNIFAGTLEGIACMAGSTNSTGDIDGGQNHCTSEASCAWISQSSATCPPA